MLRERPHRLAAATMLIVAAAFVAGLSPPVTQGSPAGAWDKKAYGCYCHSPVASTAVQFEVSGFPERHVVGESYVLTITLASTDVNLTGSAKAGFNAEVSAGTLEVPPGWQDLVQAVGVQATHRPNGTLQTRWQVSWRSPTEPAGEVVLWVEVNTVNGDGAATTADHWARLTLRSDGPAPTGGDGGSGEASTEVGVAFLAGAGVGAAAIAGWQRRRRKGGRRSAEAGGSGARLWSRPRRGRPPGERPR